MKRFLVASSALIFCTVTSAQAQVAQSPTAKAVGRLAGGKPSASYKEPRFTPKAASQSSMICYDVGADDGGCRPVFIIDSFSMMLTDVYGFAEERQRLPEVVVKGQRWSDGWSSVCVGGDCADALDSSVARGEQHSWLVEKFIEATDVRELEEKACTAAKVAPNAATKSALANTTSKSPVEQRYDAAIAAFGLTAQGAKALKAFSDSTAVKIGYAMNGAFEFTVTYSDGGSETWFHTIGVSIPLDEQPKTGSLKEGDGESKCPVEE